MVGNNHASFLRIVSDAAQNVYSSVPKTSKQVYEVPLRDVSQNMLETARNNPVLTGLGALSGAIVAVPGLASGPILAALGFGTAGPVAGSVAASAQSFAAPAAGGVFATLQSAGMAGYGTAAVNLGTSAVTASGMAFVAAYRYLGGSSRAM
ncbi:MAG: hypothetical protein M1820_008967 [Bogoriella megaspora]|nr:MAG: hypothetical protein M1820_008967 [Bogoriella megaspora]